jgi:dynein heavy chain
LKYHLQVHARDVIEKLGKVGCSSPQDFEWVSQLRFYWDKEAPSSGSPQGDCIVKQVLSVFIYGYEYQVRFCRYRFSPTGELGYSGIRGAVGLGYRFTVQAYPNLLSDIL